LVPLRNESGKADSIIGISRDITAARRWKENLKKSENLARHLAEENKIIAEIGRIISSNTEISRKSTSALLKWCTNFLPFDRISVSLNNSLDKTMRVAY